MKKPVIATGFFLLPQEIVERIPSGVYFSHYLVDIVPQFINSRLVFCGYEYTWSVFTCYPAVLEFVQRVVFLRFRH